VNTKLTPTSASADDRPDDRNLIAAITAAIVASKNGTMTILDGVPLEMRQAAIDGYHLGLKYDLVPAPRWWQRLPLLRRMYPLHATLHAGEP
jgi:hypothetical protein